MILPLGLDRLPQALGRWLARTRSWSAVGQRVALRIDESGDAKLFGQTLRGVIRNTAIDVHGEATRAIVELDAPIDYAGHYSKQGITFIITTPYLKWHDLSRLLVTSAAVRVIDGDGFEDDTYQRIIALATMKLDRGTS